MMIKDLEMTQDLARDELSAVRGGSNFGYVGGQEANQFVIGSRVTAYSAPVNAPSLGQIDNQPPHAGRYSQQYSGGVERHPDRRLWPEGLIAGLLQRESEASGPRSS
jgi:hypothetical protein